MLLSYAICSALESSDSTFIYLNTGLVIKFNIAEIHLSGVGDDGGGRDRIWDIYFGPVWLRKLNEK